MSKIIAQFLLISILLLSLFSIIKFLADFFTVKRVYLISTRPIKNGLSILNGQKLFLLDEAKVVDYLALENEEVKSIKLVKIYPNTVNLLLTFRRPKAFLTTYSSAVTIDSEGVIVSNLNNTNDLPQIDASQISQSRNTRPDWRISKALILLEDIEKQGILVTRIKIDDTNPKFDIFLSDGIETVIPQTTDSKQVAASLQIMIARFRIEGKLIKKIDFQYEKPVVILANEKEISSQ